MRWALDHSVPLSGLVISNTGFFPDGEWTGVGAALRTEGQGEALIDSISRDGLATILGQMGSGFDRSAVDEYWKAYTNEERRRGILELYRSGDLEKLEPYAGSWASWASRPWCCGARTTTSTRRSSAPTGSAGRSPARKRSSSRALATSCGRTTPSAARGR